MEEKVRDDGPGWENTALVSLAKGLASGGHDSCI